MSRLVVGLSNLLTRVRRKSVRPENLLLIFPHCLQWSDCPQNVTQNVDNCKLCGKCKIGKLVELSRRRGIKYEVASGGRLALAKVKNPDVRAVVAVACSKELRQGILAAFPKAVIGVVNIFRKEPCKDTDVDTTEVERAIDWLLRE